MGSLFLQAFIRKMLFWRLRTQIHHFWPLRFLGWNFWSFLHGILFDATTIFTFLSEPNGFRPVILNAHDGALKLVLPLAILGFPSIFLGYLAKDMIIGFGTNFGVTPSTQLQKTLILLNPNLYLFFTNLCL